MYGLLCCVSGGVAVFFGLQGVLWVLPFTAIELLAVALAFGVYARHACDKERLSLEGNTLTLCHESAGKTEQIEFRREWVQVRVVPGNPAMLELSEGRKKAFFGRFLRADLQSELLREIRMALHKSDSGKATLG